MQRKTFRRPCPAVFVSGLTSTEIVDQDAAVLSGQARICRIVEIRRRIRFDGQDIGQPARLAAMNHAREEWNLTKISLNRPDTDTLGTEKD